MNYMRNLLVSAVMLLGISASAATLTVDLNGGGGYTAIQPAIDASTDGDVVVVKPGEYVITAPITFKGKAIQVRGEAGAEETVIRMADEPADEDRASVIIFEDGETQTSVLDGFTITGGKGTHWGSAWRQNGGGGILCINNASPVCANCTFVGNSAQDFGGGIECALDASPAFTNCIISENMSGDRGGGVYCDGVGTSPTFTGCTISGNTSDDMGGGVCSYGGSPTFTDCTISVNKAEEEGGGLYFTEETADSLELTNCAITENWSETRSGGGVYCEDNVSLTFANCTIRNNWTNAGNGGGVYCIDDADLTFTDCEISGNSAGSGGGVYCLCPTAEFTNCMFSRNLARRDGGGFACLNASPKLANCTFTMNRVEAGKGGAVYCINWADATLTNCTISRNAAEGLGIGGIYIEDASPTLENCIVWGNVGGSFVANRAWTMSVTYCCFETPRAWSGAGNINSDPIFCGFSGSRDVYVDAESPADGDGTAENPFSDLAMALDGGYSLALKANSPCIAAGKDGTDMGADLGICDAGEPSVRVIHLAPGRYSIENVSLSHNVSLLGAGADETVLEGKIQGLSTGSTLSSLTVTGSTKGGLSFVWGESPHIEGCKIAGNSADDYGGGVFCHGAGTSPTFTDCEISGNSSGKFGGGIHCSSESTATFQGCIIAENAAGEDGGGVFCNYASVMLRDCAVSGNLSGENGGGIFVGFDGTGTFLNCTVRGNVALSSGGGVFGYDMVLRNCTIAGNVADWDGGGVRCTGSRSSAALTNCTISGNLAGDRGGGVGHSSSSPNNARPKLVGCIIWGNAGGSLVSWGDNPEVEVSYSCLETAEVFPGAGNINADPIFLGFVGPKEVFVNAKSPPGGDGSPFRPFRDLASALQYELSLKGNSPCIGTGRNGTNMGADLDVLGSGDPSERVVHLASGRYMMEGLSLVYGVSLLGSGEAETVVEGTVRGLRTGATISNLTVTGGTSGGIVVGFDDHPDITDCTMAGNVGSGLRCTRCSPNIVNCTMTDNMTEGSGGGVSCKDGSPKIINCIVSGNVADGSGGGVFAVGDSPSFTDCLIMGNKAEYGGGLYGGGTSTLQNCTISNNESKYGGGICSRYSAAMTLKDCRITGNTARLYGGGAYCHSSSQPPASFSTYTNCMFVGNMVEQYYGGGIYCEKAGPTFLECTISDNLTDQNAGGGVYCHQGSPTFSNCRIMKNSALGHSGGGVYCRESTANFVNCVIRENSANYRTGGIFCYNASPVLSNCTIIGNWTHTQGSAVYCYNKSFPVLTSCIVWRNVGGFLTVHEDDSAPVVTYSCLETGEVWPGEGNINEDPLFCGYAGPRDVYVNAASAEGGDGTPERPFPDLSAALEYRLSIQVNSPCIASGKGGVNMGADLGFCNAGIQASRVVHLAAGSYEIEKLALLYDASILGAGPDKTVLKGTVSGLCTGATLSGLTVTAGTEGGIVVGWGESPSIENCTIIGNRGSFGGGVRCLMDASPSFNNCKITGNMAIGFKAFSTYEPGRGGGVYCENASPTFTNCAIMGNLATGVELQHMAYGGSVYCMEDAQPAFMSCTMSGNMASWANGMLCNKGASPTLANCIIWEEGLAPACGGVSHCLTDQDPLFVHNGVFDFERFKAAVIRGREYQMPDFIIEPPDFRLQAGSPAIDAGTLAGAPDDDIEGNARPCGEGVDIGAYESGCMPGSEAFIRGDANSDDKIDLADVISMLSYLFANDASPACLDTADANDDGKIDLADAIALLNHLYTDAGPLPPPFGGCGNDPTDDDLDCESYTPCAADPAIQ